MKGRMNVCKRRIRIARVRCLGFLAVAAGCSSGSAEPPAARWSKVTSAADLDLPMAKGPFEPTAESLRPYQYPDRFRDAKYGIWVHWGPQAVPMDGDWYARGNTTRATGNTYHLAKPVDSDINCIEKVSLLGYKEQLDWEQTAEGLTVTLPEQKVSEYTAALKIMGSALTNIPYASPGADANPNAKTDEVSK